MIEHLRVRVANAFAACEQVILATCGPSGPQVSRVQCKAQGITLILHIPRSSDHLFNLEHQPYVAVLTSEWELRATAELLTPETCSVPQSWQAAVKLQPIRLQFLGADGSSFVETIDF